MLIFLSLHSQVEVDASLKARQGDAATFHHSEAASPHFSDSLLQSDKID